MRLGLLTALSLALLATHAHAYPQFQLTQAQTCVDCHVSPAGGGLLTEQGMVTAESESKTGGKPETLHGVWTPPAWLQVGGDLRIAAGAAKTRGTHPLVLPMQADIYVAPKVGAFTVYLQGGVKLSAAKDATATDFLQSREHYLMWRQNADDVNSWFVRAGKLLPVGGLRLAEHHAYPRKFGPTPLYSEKYGVAVSKIAEGYEFHLTGFIHDRLRPTVDTGDGVMAYAEKRFGDAGSVGATLRYTRSDLDYQLTVGGTGKWRTGGVLWQSEVLSTSQRLNDGQFVRQLIAYGLATVALRPSWYLEGALGYFSPNLTVGTLHRQAVDAQLRWFWSSHTELLLTGRAETVDLGRGAPLAALGLLQVHYRL